MKKRLIICCVLVLALCATMFVACNGDKLDDTALSAMLTNMQRRYANASETTTESYKMPGTATYVDGDKVLQCDVQWTVTGTTLVTVGDKDDDGYVTINVPASRETEISYTLTATLVNSKGKAYTNADGNEYSFALNRKAPKTNVLDAANNAFEQTIVKTPVEGTAYKLATWKLQQQLYFAGETVSETTTYRYKTTETYASSPNVYIENTDGGFYLYFMKGDVKTYIDLHALSSTNGTTALVTDKKQLTDNPGYGVFSVHETGALTTSTRLSADDAPILLYLGIRNKFPGQIGSMQGNYLSDKYNSLHTTEHAMYLVNAEAQMPAYDKNLTEAQILDQAFALGANEEMYGRYTLEGKVTALGTYNSSFYTQTITIEVAGKTIECYNMYIHSAGKSVKVNDKIRVTGTLANYTNEETTKVEFLAGAQFVITEVAPDENPDPTPVETTHAGTAADPYTVADAKIVAASVGSNQTENPVYVTGVVSGKISKSNRNENQYWFDIVANAGDTDKCILYYVTTTAEPKEGDVIVAKGKITLFNGNPEIVEGGIVVSVNGTDTGLDSGETPTPPTPSIASSVDKVAVADITANTAYKLVMDHTGLATPKQLYMLNEMDGYYVKSTDNVLFAADIYVEAVEGGYKLYFLKGETKNYLGAVKSGDYLNIKLDTESVWTITDEGISTKLDDTTTVWIGTAKDKTYSTFSVNASSDIVVAYLATVKEGKDLATISVDKEYEHADVTLDKTSAKIGDEVTITVTAKDDYTIGAVRVNNDPLTATSDGVYKFTVQDNSVVSIVLREPGEEPEVITSIKFDLTTTNWTDKGTGATGNADILALLKGSTGDADSNLVSVAATNVYAYTGTGGAHPSENKVLKFGKSKAGGELVLTFADGILIDKVELVCHDFYAKSDSNPTTSRTINVNSVGAQTSPYNTTGEGEKLTFDLTTATNVITINTSERAYVWEIIVHLVAETPAE